MLVYQGYLNRNQMYNEMFKNSVGLITFKKHWFHQYSSPNIAYEYADAGLYVTLTSDLTSVTDNLKEHCLFFDNYYDLWITYKMSYDMDDLYSKCLKII